MLHAPVVHVTPCMHWARLSHRSTHLSSINTAVNTARQRCAMPLTCETCMWPASRSAAEPPPRPRLRPAPCIKGCTQPIAEQILPTTCTAPQMSCNKLLQAGWVLACQAPAHARAAAVHGSIIRRSAACCVLHHAVPPQVLAAVLPCLPAPYVTSPARVHPPVIAFRS